MFHFFRGGAPQNIFKKASLDLNFALNKNLLSAKGESLVTFSRASSATYFDAAGVIQTATTNIPRFDHNPLTGESLGLLVEEQRTNYIRNNTMVGAAAGTPGTLPTNWLVNAIATGLTMTVVGTGVEGGISYIDLRINGTTSNSAGFQLSFVSSTAIAAVNGQAWANSFYCKVAAGTLANITTAVNAVNMFSSAPVNLGSIDLNFTPASSATPLGSARTANSVTTNQASTASVQPRMRLTIPSGVAVDVTIRIGLPQIEQGAFATSVIPTTTAAVTRAADVAAITGANFSSWYRQDEGTILSAFSIPTSSTTGGARVYSLSNSGVTTQIWLRLQAGTNRVYEVTDSSTQQAVLSAGTFSAGVLYKGAIAIKTNDFGFSENGSTPTTDTSGTLGTIDRLGIGMDASGAAPMNGYIRRIAYWPTRLPNTTLQKVTR